MMDRWYSSFLPKELTMAAEVRVSAKHTPLCIMCRGGKRLCGKAMCPIELKARAYVRNIDAITSKEFVGSSPPSVFVGRYGYPYVSVGPMVPPITGDTAVMDIPEEWIGKPVDDVVNYRYSLVRGSTRLPIDSVRKGGRLVESLQELSMGTSPADTEVSFLKPPVRRISFDDNSQPFGPSAPLKDFDISYVKVDQKIEKAFCDTDLKAGEAVFSLYDSGLEVSKIQKSFSMGIFGLKKNRKMVPTRWSITAVDSSLSNAMIEEVKEFETVDKYLVFTHRYQHNTFAAVLMPRKWSFEWMEAWFPGTFWNAGGASAAVMGDDEGFFGRKTYPGIGGCYFSTRLAVAEYLRKVRRQATALVVREIMPEFPLPLGVWFVRENIRSMLKGTPKEFDDLKSCLTYLKTFLTVPIPKWLEESAILRDTILQRRMDDYFHCSEFKQLG
jgi:hypothetical protein